ncbi:MAG: hypothetical protein GXP38_08060 [Chloroflexi bacterium]|nr:hypothetical protein [Chloroflexota bacterium]
MTTTLPTLIGVDIGTNATKAVLYDLEGHELAVVSRGYPLLTPRPGWVEQDAEAVWQALVEVLVEIVKSAGERPILGLALAAQAGSIIPCDESGDPVYAMITWLDQRSQDIVSRWQEDDTVENIRQLSGWRPFPGLPLPSIAWLQKHRPDIHAASKRYLGPADFCIHRLTGRFATDLSAAAEMLLVDLQKASWSPELCSLVGVDPANQSSLGWAGRVVGRITESVAQQTGLKAGTPVIAGGHDQCCASLGMGMIDAGRVMLSTGTAWVITAIADSPDLGSIPERMDLNFHVVPQRWTPSQYLGGFGATVQWWLDQMWQSPDPAHPLARKQRFALLDAALLESEAGSHGLIFLPLGGPAQMQGFSQGAFIGLTLAHTRTDMSRAILEGTAFEVRWALENLHKAGMPVSELWIAGGAANSPVWPQILADISGVPIVLADYPSWAALGAAVLAGYGIGAFSSLAEGVTRLQPPVRRLSPDPELIPRYRQAFGRYQELTRLLAG